MNTQCVLLYRRVAVIKVEVWEIIHCEIVAADNLHDRGIQNGGARLDIVQPQPFINHSQPSLVAIQYLSSRESEKRERERKRNDLLLAISVYTIPKSLSHTVEDQNTITEYIPSDSWIATPTMLCWLLILTVIKHFLYLITWIYGLKWENHLHAVVKHPQYQKKHEALVTNLPIKWRKKQPLDSD